ncbi:arf-GAP with SH3 domain, ANK repeat and PH domain-containing protein 1-like isoform X2 [Halichondria panicea]|uniref:arf-GAP with SH3 domain, ANK repeat and PH domain-containing protein 1-like isoform X2 n=1 Tax=Halichondria panicea TaxID=6063 RepID=UPI00312BC4E1
MSADIVGPGKKLSHFVAQFVKELEDDFQSPTISRFQEHMPDCREGLLGMEESLSTDKSHVHKLIGSIKELSKCSEAHGNSMKNVAEDLVKFGTTISTAESLMGNSFVKFGTLLHQLSSILTNLANSSKNILLFSLNHLFENDLKGSRYKSDIKALFGQYQSARNQAEREERKMLVAAGADVSGRVFTPEELAGKLILDRRKFQLGVVEYMSKFNEVKTKRGVDLAEHLVAYYQAQEDYFQDGNLIMKALKAWEGRFTTQCSEQRTKQDNEKKLLTEARGKIRSAMGIMGGKAQGPIQVDPSLATSMTDKAGQLGKKPDLSLRFPWKQWPKKYCTISMMNGFTLANSHNHAPHVKIQVMHFQYKDSHEPIEGRKYCFKLITQTRTYTFDAESEKELQDWKQAMQNCQLKLFQGEMEGTLARNRSSYSQHTPGSDTRQLVKLIISKIRSLPGNNRCVDCGAPDPEWLSVNLGILMCINCSGRHRELSVQYSRIRSLTLDKMKTTELLIALVMGNEILNEVLEANITDTKPTPEASLDQRGEYCSRKYLERKYIEHSTDKDTLLHELAEAVDSRDIKQLLQVYTEGVNLTAPLPGYSRGITALHLAIELEDLTSLHIVDFLLGNGHTENVVDDDGNTPLHLAVSNDNPQCVKLLLNHGADITIKNKEGRNPMDLAEETSYDECIELLQDASKKKFSKCEHIDVDWGVGGDGEEDIYQIPVAPSTSPSGDSSLKRSETTGNMADDVSVVVHKPPVKSISALGGLAGGVRRRPISTYQIESRSPRVSHSTPSLVPQPTEGGGTLAPSQPAPSEPAPPPPPRTVSKTAEPLGLPVPPKRKKRLSMMPELLEPMTSSPGRLLVEAVFDCSPDHRDELEFKEGEMIIVTKKVSKDWWRGHLQSDPSREGIFPINYVHEVSSSPLALVHKSPTPTD